MSLVALGLMLTLGALPQNDGRLDVANFHGWRVIQETPERSIAVMADVPNGAGNDRDLWMFITLAEPTADGSGGQTRQAASLHRVDCAARTTRYVSGYAARGDEPPQAYRWTPPVDGVPVGPIPIEPAPSPRRPVPPGTVLDVAVTVVCGGDPGRYPRLEGDWASVLDALLRRSDASAAARR